MQSWPYSSASVLRTALSVLASLAAIAACSSADSRDGLSDARFSGLPEGETRARDESQQTPKDDTRKGLETAGENELAMGCEKDDDCVRMEKGCCPMGNYIAVSKPKAKAYQKSLHCEVVSCPLVMIADDHSVAHCDAEKKACEIVLPHDIACGGLTTNPHKCPDGWRCRLPKDVADVPGRCVQFCGGFGNLPCATSGDQCVDDPDDDCDPKRGGADCGGICVQSSR